MSDNVLVRVFPWRRKKVDTRGAIGLLPSPSNSTPLNFSWVLCVPRFEITYEKGDWTEPDKTDQKNRFLIVDYEKLEVVHELNVQDNAVTAVSISENGRGIALVSRNRSFTVFDHHSPLLHTWSVNDDQSRKKEKVIEVKVDARCIAMNPGDTHVAIGGLDGQVVVVDLKSGLEVLRLILAITTIATFSLAGPALRKNYRASAIASGRLFAAELPRKGYQDIRRSSDLRFRRMANSC